MSKMMNKFSLGLTVAIGVALLAYYQSDSTIEDVGEQIALKLLEILPRKHKEGVRAAFKILTFYKTSTLSAERYT